MIKRREFLKTSVAGATGVLTLGAYACGSGKKQDAETEDAVKAAAGMGVGLQLYSIRDAMKADAAGSLKKIGDMGYRYIEMASYADGKFISPTLFSSAISFLYDSGFLSFSGIHG